MGRASRVRTVSSECFSKPVADVLDGAAEADLAQIAIIGIDGNGELFVASNTGTPQTLALFEQARPEIERLRKD
jgi:hypothetical protein